jgi:hypothetical protein
MYLFDTVNRLTNDKEIISGKSLIEICGSILEYYNGIKPDNKDHTVIFFDKSGKKIYEMYENSLKYAIHGEISESTNKIDSMMKTEASKFMTMIHSEIDIIEFSNQVRKGEAYWDDEYEEEDEADNEDDIEYEGGYDDMSEVNYNK